MAGSWSGKRIAAMLGVCALGVAGLLLPALVTAAAVLVILVILIVAETVAAMRRRHRKELSPLEALEARLAGEPAP
jgi:membrane protein implicated in regulation of membrane protease activity